MTFLPIVGRELRVASRRKGTYRTRLALALVAVLIGLCIFVGTAGLPAHQTGRFIFQGLSWLCLLYGLSSGRRLTVDCLSEEKREGTLGLLFLTDLRGYDVVLGKLAATSLAGFYGLLAVFPVLALPVLMGGITSGEFWRTVLVLVNTSLFSLAVGIFGSAVSRDYHRAVATNFLLLLLLIGAAPACAGVLATFIPRGRLIPELLLSCPAYSLYLCGDAPYSLRPDHFWWSAGVIQGLMWGLLFLASWIAPRTWQDRPARAVSPRLSGEPRPSGSHGRPARQQSVRKRFLDFNAYYWLAARARFKPAQVWAFLGCAAAWWVVGRISAGTMWLDEAVAVTTALILNTTLKCWVVLEAGRRLAEDQKSGALELLLSTPLKVDDILRGQLLALRRQFLGPVLVVVAVELGFMWQLHGRSVDSMVVPIWVGAILMLVADLVALSWVAMWHALTARSQYHATLKTVWRVLILPWVVVGAVVVFKHLWVELVRQKPWSPGSKTYLNLWLATGLGTDLGFGLWAWWQLHTRFRQLVLQRLDPRPASLARLFARPRVASDSPKEPPQPHAEASQPRPQPARWRRRLAVPVGAGLVLLAFGLVVLARKLRPSFPPPLVVSLTQSNAPLGVFPVAGTSGLYLILPDGSLWGWGQLARAPALRAVGPEQIGTNCDWMQAAASLRHGVGLRRDGSLWAWDLVGGHSGGKLAQVGPSRDWVSLSATVSDVTALRRDGTLWVCADNSWGLLGSGATTSLVTPSQVGTDHNWAAVCRHWNCSLGLRTDGTLWVWGQASSVGSGSFWQAAFSTPTRVCRETNWIGFSVGFQGGLARTRSGEIWEPLSAPPDPDAPAMSTCRLVVSNSAPDRVAAAFTGQIELCEVRPDGTLWKRAYPWGPHVAARLPDQWLRVGKRSDWISIWGTGGTALGLTSDGILWTWGIDPGQEPTLDLLFSLRLIPARLRAVFGAAPLRVGTPRQPYYRKEPRPLMRLIPAKSGKD